MAGEMHKLTAKAVEHATGPARLSDGGGLYLSVTAKGSKWWIFMFKSAGRRREMGLGSAGKGQVSLSLARKKAAHAREAVLTGEDPLSLRDETARAKVAAKTTFGSFANEFIAYHRDSWSNPKHAAQWSMTLGDAYCRSIRSKAIADVSIEDVLRILKPIWLTKPETARRVRMRLEKVLDAARVRGLRTGENPARLRGNLEHVLPRQPVRKGHHAAMAWERVPTFMAELADQGGTAARALEFAILTASRTSEVLNAAWREIDEGQAIWTVPAERMKARRLHRVPLSEGALAALTAVRNRHEKMLFPSPRGKVLSNMAMSAVLKRLKVTDATVHGFRSSFRDWTAEATSFQGEVAEMALAHSIGDRTEAAYRRGDLFEKRRRLMDAWGTYCLSSLSLEGADNVRALHNG